MPTHHTVPVGDEEVVAVHHESEGDGWIFFSHGFVSDMSGYERRSERAVDEGYDAVRFDHRGCGGSSRLFGEQTLTTRIEDLCAVVDYFDASSYVLFGSSFGGKVVLHASAAELDRANAAVVRAPVTYNAPMERYRNEGTAEAVADGFFDDLDRHGFSEVEESLTVPVAFFHGREDDTVDVAYSFEAAVSVGSDAVVEVYEDEGHRFSDTAEERLLDRTFGWLSTVVDEAT
ncbi:alpha/beta hydrolase [Haladaptatus sp. F3-133]|jgi:pimeloyl-ACP methyl ester carboxylesterase|uniref:Alpha/beta hydrolase n=1 Tax=Halorutilus salinus TaxID=2487751 RepID=A0A9Q4C3H3_9EURY|nr:alpha/beta hydrolase [Halorutilus salinus]MCX2818275.1 alpha/beta hydrolase [Halorutilus salinus]